MGRLTKAAVLAAAAPKVEEVEVPEWGGSVLVRTMTAIDREDFLIAIIGTDRLVDRRIQRIALAARTIVDDKGKLMFTVEELQEMDYRGLDRILAVADRLNMIDEQRVEEAGKNSSRGPSDDSSADGR